MRQKLRSAEGQRIYQKRKSTVEPVFGVLKQQRGLRQFRLRGLQQVAIEFTLAGTAYDLTRMYNSVPQHLRTNRKRFARSQLLR